MRSAELDDLDQFLSDLNNPIFTGKIKEQYGKWMVERKGLQRDADAVNEWFRSPHPIATAADANAALKDVLDRIDTYYKRSNFSDKAKAAVWRVKARLEVVNALKELTGKQYREAVQAKLPLASGNNAVSTARDAHRELKSQISALTASFRIADEEKALFEPKVRDEVEGIGAVEDECAAREELLDLFARDDLFTNPNSATEWLKQVAARYKRTKDEKVRKLIRGKVQEFCDAFIPVAARLDDYVQLLGTEVLRKDVQFKHHVTTAGVDETTKPKPLSDTLDGINEFNLAERCPGPGTFALDRNGEWRPKELTPTKLSWAVKMYNEEREKIANSTTGPKWSLKSVSDLKNACEPQKKLVDQMQIPDGAVGGKSPKIWTRLSGLAVAMADCAELFENER